MNCYNLQQNAFAASEEMRGSVPIIDEDSVDVLRFMLRFYLDLVHAVWVKDLVLNLGPFFFSEWAMNIQRDSYASYIGHYPLLAYFAIAENESIGREHCSFMQKMLMLCGLPPKEED